MRVLKAIAVLMDYPGDTVQQHGNELVTLFDGQEGLAPATREGVAGLAGRLQSEDLYDLQARYVEMFDRGRSLALHLFEHVHGESRDRGQAMVDLVNIYREHGLEIDASELPDYLPLFLEFCSRLPESESREWLGEVSHLLQLLHARLVERDSDYQWLFKALLELGELETADEQLQHQVRGEERDDTPEALDRAWAEEPVTFGPTADGCGGARTNQGQEVPVDWSALKRNSA